MNQSIATRLCEAALVAARSLRSNSGRLDRGRMRTVIRQELLELSLVEKSLASDSAKIQALTEAVIVAVEAQLQGENLRKKGADQSHERA